MDHDSWRLREALEKLRGWGMPSVFICLNSEFGYTDNTLSRPPEDTGAANRDELRAMVGLVENGLERAAQEVLELTGKNLVHRFRKSFTFQPFGSRSSSIGSERVGHSSRRCL